MAAELVVQKRPMTLVIKCEPIDGFKRRVQKLLHRTHAHRQWRGAELLAAKGITSAEAMAIVCGQRDGALVECLIMQSLPGASCLLRTIAERQLGVRDEHRLAREVGKLIAFMIQKRVVNADPKAVEHHSHEQGGND